MSSNTVIIIGKNWLFRRGLKPVLHKLKLVVVGDGDDVSSAFRACTSGDVPDLVIFVDYSLESSTVSAAELRKTQRIGPETIKVVVSNTNWTQEDEAMLGSDIDAILSSTLSYKMLVNALELIMAGHRILARPPSRHPLPHIRAPLVNNLDVGATQASVTSMLSRSMWTSPPQLSTKQEVLKIEPFLPRLSSRERQTLRCLVIGQPNKVIAAGLSVAETTVKVHVKSLLRKLRVANRTQAAIWAINNSQICGLEAITTLDGALPANNGSVINEFDVKRFIGRA